MHPLPEIQHDRGPRPLGGRRAARRDHAPAGLRDGDALPRGWHAILFNAALPQLALGEDGFVPPPADLGLQRPRLMLGGRRTTYAGDIPIGAPVRRKRHLLSQTAKEGRSGRLVLVTRRHEIHVADQPMPAVVEEEDLVYREAGGAAPAGEPPPPGRPASRAETVTPDETLLFRYSSVTFNAHRIHYDLPYAQAVEGYPALVVNGGLTALLLLRLHARVAGRPPASVAARNRRPLYCGRPVTLKAEPEGAAWQLWAEDETGRPALEMQIE